MERKFELTGKHSRLLPLQPLQKAKFQESGSLKTSHHQAKDSKLFLSFKYVIFT